MAHDTPDLNKSRRTSLARQGTAAVVGTRHSGPVKARSCRERPTQYTGLPRTMSSSGDVCMANRWESSMGNC